jgi:hypothetical protein
MNQTQAAGGEVSDLARELAAHPRFAEGHRLPPGFGEAWVRREPGLLWRWTPEDWRLDLTDAATAGCLVDMLDPSGMRGITICRERDGTWWVDTYIAPSLGEAAARALLASWGSA